MSNDSIERNEALTSKVARLQAALMALDADLASARKALALSVHETLYEGGGVPDAAQAMTALLDQAVGDYVFALHEAVDAFASAAPGPS
jgi:hypothetical protein